MFFKKTKSTTSFECLYELYMLEYDKIDVSEGIDVNKTNA